MYAPLACFSVNVNVCSVSDTAEYEDRLSISMSSSDSIREQDSLPHQDTDDVEPSIDTRRSDPGTSALPIHHTTQEGATPVAARPSSADFGQHSDTSNAGNRNQIDEPLRQPCQADADNLPLLYRIAHRQADKPDSLGREPRSQSSIRRTTRAGKIGTSAAFDEAVAEALEKVRQVYVNRPLGARKIPRPSHSDELAIRLLLADQRLAVDIDEILRVLLPLQEEELEAQLRQLLDEKDLIESDALMRQSYASNYSPMEHAREAHENYPIGHSTPHASSSSQADHPQSNEQQTNVTRTSGTVPGWSPPTTAADPTAPPSSSALEALSTAAREAKQREEDVTMAKEQASSMISCIKEEWVKVPAQRLVSGLDKMRTAIGRNAIADCAEFDPTLAVSLVTSTLAVYGPGLNYRGCVANTLRTMEDAPTVPLQDAWGLAVESFVAAEGRKAYSPPVSPIPKVIAPPTPSAATATPLPSSLPSLFGVAPPSGVSPFQAALAQHAQTPHPTQCAPTPSCVPVGLAPPLLAPPELQESPSELASCMQSAVSSHLAADLQNKPLGLFGPPSKRPLPAVPTDDELRAQYDKECTDFASLVQDRVGKPSEVLDEWIDRKGRELAKTSEELHRRGVNRRAPDLHLPPTTPALASAASVLELTRAYPSAFQGPSAPHLSSTLGRPAEEPPFTKLETLSTTGLRQPELPSSPPWYGNPAATGLDTSAVRPPASVFTDLWLQAEHTDERNKGRTKQCPITANVLASTLKLDQSAHGKRVYAMSRGGLLVMLAKIYVYQLFELGDESAAANEVLRSLCIASKSIAGFSEADELRLNIALADATGHAGLKEAIDAIDKHFLQGSTDDGEAHFLSITWKPGTTASHLLSELIVAGTPHKVAGQRIITRWQSLVRQQGEQEGPGKNHANAVADLFARYTNKYASIAELEERIKANSVSGRTPLPSAAPVGRRGAALPPTDVNAGEPEPLSEMQQILAALTLNTAAAAAAAAGDQSDTTGGREKPWIQKPLGPLKHLDKIVRDGKIRAFTGKTLRPTINPDRADGMYGLNCFMCEHKETTAIQAKANGDDPEITNIQFKDKFGGFPSKDNMHRECVIVHWQENCHWVKLAVCGHVKSHPEDTSYLECFSKEEFAIHLAQLRAQANQ